MHRILVIGETCVDKFVYGTVTRICPEAPVPVFVPDPSKTIRTMGMASNVQRNISAIDSLCEIDIITNKIFCPVKIRYVDAKSNHMIVRIDEEDVIPEKFNIDDIPFGRYDAIVVSDYDKGFLTMNDLHRISFAHPLTFLDTKKPLGGFCVNYSFIKINEPEFNSIPDKMDAVLVNIANKLIVTLSEKGCRHNGKIYPPADVSYVMDISGAGDTFMAGLVCKYLSTTDIEKAIVFANECAGKVVHKKGVATI